MKRRVPLHTLKPGQRFTYHDQDYFVGGLVFDNFHNIACYEAGEEYSRPEIFNIHEDWVDFDDGLPAGAKDLKEGDVVFWRGIEVRIVAVSATQVVLRSLPGGGFIVKSLELMDDFGFVWKEGAP